MKSIYTCKACRYTFSYLGKCERCPDCGRFAVRAATKRERAEYARFQDPENMRRYVQVAYEDSQTDWFIDYSDSLEIGNFVIVEKRSREVPAEVFEVLQCSKYDPPVEGHIKAVLRIFKK